MRLISSKLQAGGFSGRCFVKFSTASGAALAAEALDGVALDGETPPIKVTFAVPKGMPKEVLEDGETPPRSRLFVTYLKSLTEEVCVRPPLHLAPTIPCYPPPYHPPLSLLWLATKDPTIYGPDIRTISVSIRNLSKLHKPMI